jgi:hypothetical protein
MEESETECAICFNTIAEEDQLPLPCQCRVPYCSACWDRALAAAFNDSGAARCPTCRCAVQVDFDPDGADGRGRLVFTRADDDELASLGAAERGSEAARVAMHEARAKVVNRLAEQGAPLMTRNLRAYGAQHPYLRAAALDPGVTLAPRPIRELKALLKALGGELAGCVEKADIIERMEAAARGKANLAAFCAATDEQRAGGAADAQAGGAADAQADAAGATPGSEMRSRCVCGGRLERMEGRARTRCVLTTQFPQAEEHPEELERMLDVLQASGHSHLVCDLCDAEIPPRVAVFTCSNGGRTILHATAYDICEPCFVRYAVQGLGDEGLAGERRLA